MTNSNVSGNSAAGFGAGIDSFGQGTLTVTSSTVSGNSSAATAPASSLAERGP